MPTTAQQHLDAHGVPELARLFRALADETRIRIVALLAHGELCVCHLERALEVGQPNVSRHLGILRMNGVAEARRDGTWVYYRLAPQAHATVEAVLKTLTEAFADARTLRADHARLRKVIGPGSCA